MHSLHAPEVCGGNYAISSSLDHHKAMFHCVSRFSNGPSESDHHKVISIVFGVFHELVASMGQV